MASDAEIRRVDFETFRASFRDKQIPLTCQSDGDDVAAFRSGCPLVLRYQRRAPVFPNESHVLAKGTEFRHLPQESSFSDSRNEIRAAREGQERVGSPSCAAMWRVEGHDQID